MDTNIRAMLQLTSSVSLGYLLDNADLDISVVRENDMSYLNYDLTKDKELEDMMSAGLVPMTYPDFVSHVEQLEQKTGRSLARKTRYALDIHAELKLLAHLAENNILAYHYVGASKLCCVGCWLFFEAYARVAAESNTQGFFVRGCHSKVYQWAAPVTSFSNMVLTEMRPLAENFFRLLKPKFKPRQLSESSTGSLSAHSVHIPWRRMRETAEKR